ncbi:MAG: hypothetical protein Q9161_001694 [Pseudevernia consocians]
MTGVLTVCLRVDLILPKLAKVIHNLSQSAIKLKYLPTLGITHYQATQPMSLGPRAAQSAQDLLNMVLPSKLINGLPSSQKPVWDELDPLLDPKLFIGRSAEIVERYVGPDGPVTGQAGQVQGPHRFKNQLPQRSLFDPNDHDCIAPSD